MSQVLFGAFMLSAFVGVIWNSIRFKQVDPNSIPDSMNVPHKPEKSDQGDRTGLDAIVRIYAALLDSGAVNGSFGSQLAPPTAPAIAAFNAFGQCIGVANSFWNVDDLNRIENGAYRDFRVHQTAGPGQQVAYMQIYATGTPICIPAITMKMADGTPKAFIGDFGRACGAAWYYSNVEFSTNHQPDCFWLDSGNRQNHNYTKGEECTRLKGECANSRDNCVDCNEIDDTLMYQFPTNLRYLPKAMQFTTSTFSRSGDEDEENAHPPTLETMCGEDSLTFRHYLNGDFEFRPNLESYWDTDLVREIPIPRENPNFKPDSITLFEQGSDLSIQKREDSSSDAPTQPWNFYVSSPGAEHSAIRLCGSVTSLGPDFYSESERKFCDMGLPGSGSRIVYDRCDERNILPCWNLNTHQVDDWPAKLKKRSVKGYTHKVQWKANGLKSVIQLLGNMGRLATTSNGTAASSNATIG